MKEENKEIITNPTPPLPDENEEKIELRSREVQEILARPPKKLVRYGTAVVCGILAILIGSSFFFSYPDIISGEAIITTSSSAPEEFIAFIQVPINGAGKIQTGQRIIIKLAAYPYLEFGYLEGFTRDISLAPNKNYYLVKATIDQNLITTNKKQLIFNGKLIGTADIITENRTFIERIFYPIKYLRK